MTKPILYVAEQDYFISDVFDYVNEIVGNSVLSSLGYYITRSKKYVNPEQKKQFYLKEAEELSKHIPSDLFDLFFYKVSIEEHICFIKESSIIEIINRSPNMGVNEISVTTKELIEIEYFLEYYELITINDYQEFILKFIEVKGGEHMGLTRNIKDFILMNVLLELADGKDKNENPVSIKPKTNKSLLFEGKDLNLLERYKIANKVLNIDKVIRKLNIKDLEKYQLLAYILGCDKDNARNLMNGTYNGKDRDLSNYFNDLGLNE